MGFKCDQCEREFKERKSLDQHIQAKHTKQNLSERVIKRKESKNIRKQEKATLKSSVSKRKSLKYGLVIIVLLVIGYGAYIFYSNPMSSGNISINSQIPSGPIHWHPTLTIKINNQNQIIPANVGLGTVHQPIHTHKEDNLQGVLHIENNNPTEENMKLGFFFRVWGKKFNSECIFEFCNTENKSVKMFVNGEPNFEFDDHILKENDRIKIEYS